MIAVFFLLMAVSVLAILVGIIKPKLVVRWGNEAQRTRKAVLIVYGLAAIVFFVGMIATAPESSKDKGKQAVNVQDNNTKTAEKEVQSADKKEPVTDKKELPTTAKADNSSNDKTTEEQSVKNDVAKIGEVKNTASQVSMLDYFPLLKDVSYVLTDGKTSWQHKYIGKKLVDGNQAIVLSKGVVNTIEKKVEEPSMDLYSIDKQEILSLGQVSSKGKTTWKTNPEVKYPSLMQVNKEYTYQDNQILSTTRKVIPKGFVDVEVSGRKFENCLFIVEQTVIDNPGKNKTEINSKQYFAKDIGLIYYEHDWIWTDLEKNKTDKSYANMYYVNMGSPKF